jgi:hypothetical protein
MGYPSRAALSKALGALRVHRDLARLLQRSRKQHEIVRYRLLLERLRIRHFDVAFTETEVIRMLAAEARKASVTIEFDGEAPFGQGWIFRASCKPSTTFGAV